MKPLVRIPPELNVQTVVDTTKVPIKTHNITQPQNVPPDSSTKIKKNFKNLFIHLSKSFSAFISNWWLFNQTKKNPLSLCFYLFSCLRYNILLWLIDLQVDVVKWNLFDKFCIEQKKVSTWADILNTFMWNINKGLLECRCKVYGARKEGKSATCCAPGMLIL